MTTPPSCECGCGAPVHKLRKKWTRQWRRFLHGHNSRVRSGTQHCYVKVTEAGQYKGEHVLVSEGVLGRQLPHGACVHHVDGNGRNNAHRNLVICQDTAYHSLLHVRERVLRAGGDPDTQRICGSCRCVLNFDQFYRRSHTVQTWCKECSRTYNRGRPRRGRDIRLDPAAHEAKKAYMRDYHAQRKAKREEHGGEL